MKNGRWDRAPSLFSRSRLQTTGCWGGFGAGGGLAWAGAEACHRSGSDPRRLRSRKESVMYLDNRGALARSRDYNVRRQEARYVSSVPVGLQRVLRFGPLL